MLTRSLVASVFAAALLAPLALGELTPVPARGYGLTAIATAPDPLSSEEWWRGSVGIEGLVPPGPGIPVTIIDSGIFLGHPEFAGRPNTEALNPQEPQPLGGEHGTMVASVVGAPENGVGVVGIYPQARIRGWDAALGAGTRLDPDEVARGIVAAARSGPGVINLSLGGPRDDVIEAAVAEAVARGSLVVAASGNEGTAGNELEYPAALPHVLTVAATGRDGAVAGFSSTSPYVDLAAPGTEITVASALSGGWLSASGTSFAAPLVSGAAAWIWTLRPELTADQVGEILRRSARDLAPAGRDSVSGFGALDVAAALALPAPIPDRVEPNDDVADVDPTTALNTSTSQPLTTRTRPRGAVAARVDKLEDPRDVFRIWLPARRTVVVTATADTDVDLALYRSTAPTVIGAFPSDRLGRARTLGPVERLSLRTGRSAGWAYLVVTPGGSTIAATYRLVTSRRA